MPRIVTHKKKVTKVEIGSMNSRISLEVRSIVPPELAVDEYTMNFKKRLDLWASAETVNGVTMFDSTNIERTVTHKFFIRYVENVTFENWILYKNNLYDLIRAEDDGEEHRYIILWANLRGLQTLGVNLA